MTVLDIHNFQKFIKEKGELLFRSMPWRENTSFFNVFVSELMLQQTQVDRVISKFNEFVSVLPDFDSIATSPFKNVLELWSGLGYNRRAKFLHESAKIIVSTKNFDRESFDELVALPGIGKATASAILTYSVNKPYLFIETNIRQVVLYHFFINEFDVPDKKIMAILEQIIDPESPRQFYWAMMDYGTFLKKEVGNITVLSKTYSKQSKFNGSFRQKRGVILRELLKQSFDAMELQTKTGATPEEILQLLLDMKGEGLIEEFGGRYYIK